MSVETQSTSDRERPRAFEGVRTVIRKIVGTVAKVCAVVYLLICMFQLLTAPMGLAYPVMISEAWQNGNMAGVVAGLLLTANYTAILYGMSRP